MRRALQDLLPGSYNRGRGFHGSQRCVEVVYSVYRYASPQPYLTVSHATLSRSPTSRPPIGCKTDGSETREAGLSKITEVADPRLEPTHAKTLQQVAVELQTLRFGHVWAIPADCAPLLTNTVTDTATFFLLQHFLNQPIAAGYRHCTGQTGRRLWQQARLEEQPALKRCQAGIPSARVASAADHELRIRYLYSGGGVDAAAAAGSAPAPVQQYGLWHLLRFYRQWGQRRWRLTVHVRTQKVGVEGRGPAVDAPTPTALR